MSIYGDWSKVFEFIVYKARVFNSKRPITSNGIPEWLQIVDTKNG